MAYGKISLTVLTVLVFRQKISFGRTLRASKPQLARSGVMIFAVAVRELTNRLTQQLLLHSDSEDYYPRSNSDSVLLARLLL